MTTVKAEARPPAVSVRPRLNLVRYLILLGAVIVLLILEAVLRPGSVTVGQVLNVSRQASALGIVVIGQALVILAGGIDLSVGSVLTLANIVSVSMMMGTDNGFLPIILICLALGALVGAVNGLGVVKLRIAPFVMTLCTMSVVQGIYLVYTGGSPRGSAAPLLRFIGTGYLFDWIPYATIIWLFLAGLAALVLHRTTFGRAIYAAGGNPAAARLSGLSVSWTRVFTYIASGILSSAAGLIMSGYIGTSSMTIGADMVTNSLAAVLIGGNAIEGGRGGIAGVALGAFLTMLLFSLLTMLNLGQVGKLIIQGAIIFIVVAVQSRKR